MEALIVRAKIAEKADHYDDMVSAVRGIVTRLDVTEPDDEVRDLIAVAFKNCISKKRYSWRILNQIIQIEERRERKVPAEVAMEYRQQIECEIINLCEEVNQTAEHLSKHSSEISTRAFFIKMRADYQRYLAELSTPKRDSAIAEAIRLYDEAINCGLPSNHHISFAIILNQAIFYYEILQDKDTAIQIVEKALSLVPGVADERNRPMIVTLLDNNLQLWKSLSTN